MRQRVLGVGLSYLQIVIKLAVTLAFTPFLVRSLGVEGYGLFALLGAMAAYLYILDFGLKDSLLRFFVTHEKDTAARDAFLARMLGLFGLIGLAVLLLSWVLSRMTGLIFGASNTPEHVQDLSQMLLLTGGAAAVLVAATPIGSMLSAMEEYLFLRGSEIVLTLLSTAAMVIVLLAGLGPVELVMVSAGSMIVQVAAGLVFVVGLRGVRVRIAPPHLRELRGVAGYAAPIFVSMIAAVIFWKLDSVLIGAWLGVGAVAIYAIGVTFNKYFMSFAMALTRIMTPEIIRRVDKGAGPDELTDLMVRVSRVQAIVLLLVLCSLIVFGQRFLTLWLGPEFAVSYWVMLAILCPYALELTGNARNIILQVKGLYWHKSGITLSMALLNIPLTIVLLGVMGVVGAAVSTGIAVLLGYLMIAVLLKMKVGLQIGRYWWQTARGILPVAALVTAAGLLAEPHLPVGWGALALGGLAFLAFFAAATWVFAMSVDERGFFLRLLRRGRPRKSDEA